MIFSRLYLSNSRAYGMIIVRRRLFLRLYVTDMLCTWINDAR